MLAPQSLKLLLLSLAGWAYAGTALAAPPLFKPIENGRLSLQAQQRIQGATLARAVVSKLPAAVDAAGLQARTAAVDLVVPGGIALTATRHASRVLANGDLEWIGSVDPVARAGKAASEAQDSNGMVYMIRSSDGLYANLHLADQLYRVRPTGHGQYAIVEIDKAQLPDDEDAAAYAEMLRTPSARKPGATTQDVVPTAASVIRVAVPYTPKAATALGNVGAEVDLAFAEANAALANSGIDASLENAGVFAVTGRETNNYATMLSRLRSADDGYYDNVPGERDVRAADIVTAVVDESRTLCGQADGIEVGAANAYAVVSHACLSGNYTFVHEIGHLIGARHDNDPSTSPRAYAHGYVNSAGKWRTIMAVNSNTCCVRQGFFSNPLRSYNGAVTGTAASNDNARVWNLRHVEVAGFR